MSEDRLRTLLREARVPDAADAEERGLRLLRQAHAERHPATRPLLPRLAVAMAAVTLLGAAVLSPAGAAVRDWFDDVFSGGVREAAPALTELPGGGRLLVQSSGETWVVQPSGSRRLLGDYADASWSPRGLFVATTAGRDLSAIEPGGAPHWSLSARSRTSEPRWSPSGFRIAYRAGHALRVVAGDGTGDMLLDPRSAPVPPAWFPPGLHLLAYVDAGQRLRIADTDTGSTLGFVPAAAGVRELAWSHDGSLLLQSTPRALWLRGVRISKLTAGLELGRPRRLPLPPGAEVEAAAFSPRSRAIATLLRRPGQAGTTRSEVVLLDPAGGPARRLFAVSGGLADLAWSPDGGRILLAWPAADQWLFVPLDAPGRPQAIGGISAAFSPGARGPAPFPRIEGWCCPATLGGAG